MTPPITVQVADRDLTAAHDGLVYSNSDPGGNEICQLDPQQIAGLRPGAPVVVRYGMEYAWHGRLNEPGQHSQGQVDTFQLAAVGYSAALKDNPFREIYVDRDLSRWRAPGTTRQRNLVAASQNPQSAGVVLPDPTSGSPTLLNRVTGSWGATVKPVSEAWYDGQGVALGSLYYAWTKGATITLPDANWVWNAALSVDDAAATVDVTANLSGAGPGTGTLTATAANRRFALVALSYGAAGGTEQTNYDLFWSTLAVYGTHGLAIRGGSPGGFYPSDIARNALQRSKTGIAAGVIEAAGGLILPHSVYLTPTGADQVIDDMAKLMGWHWGVWEPQTTLDSQPTLHFRAPPTDATAIVSRAECVELEPPKVRYDLLYDTAQVSWRDQAGTTGVVTVTLPNPLLGEAAGSGRTLVLDMGLGDSSSAQAFGSFALLLAQRTARGGGYAILPDTVALPGGGRKPACLLKAGRDRLRISDLPDAGPLHESDTRRFDTFHVRRVETTIRNGVPSTRVDFDGGADLMEVLTARLAAFAPLLD